MSNRRKTKAEPVKLAKVISFDEVAERNRGVGASEYRTASAEWTRLWNLERKTPAALSELELSALLELIRSALKKTLEEKVEFENELGGRYTLCAQNALFQDGLIRRLKNMSNAFEWTKQELTKRTSATAKLYDIAEFRRFRNRIASKGATP